MRALYLFTPLIKSEFMESEQKNSTMLTPFPIVPKFVRALLPTRGVITPKEAVVYMIEHRARSNMVK